MVRNPDGKHYLLFLVFSSVRLFTLTMSNHPAVLQGTQKWDEEPLPDKTEVGRMP